MERRGLRSVAQGLGALAVLVGAWELASRLGPWPPHLLPGPGRVAASLGGLLADGRLVAASARSLARLAQGYAVSALAGVGLGLALARSSLVHATLKPLVLGLQALPSICWLPLALLWFGLSDTAILFVVVMGSVLAVAIAVEDGVRSVDPQLLRLSGTLGVRGWRLWLGVLLPAALPGIVTGLKLGWSFAWRALLAGELLFVSGGLGQLLSMGRELLDVPQVMAVMVAIVVLGTLVDRLLFQQLEQRVRQRWGLLEAR